MTNKSLRDYINLIETAEQGVAEGKKPEHNLGPGWMLDKDKALGQKVDQARARYSELYKTTQRVDPRTGKKIVQKGVAEGSSEIKIPTEDGITMQDIRLMAGEGPLTKKTILQAIAVIRKQRRPQGVAEGKK